MKIKTTLLQKYPTPLTIAGLLVVAFVLLPSTASAQAVTKYVRCSNDSTPADSKPSPTRAQVRCSGGTIELLSSRTEGSFAIPMTCSSGGSILPPPTEFSRGQSFVVYACDSRADAISVNVRSVNDENNDLAQAVAQGGVDEIDNTLTCDDGQEGIQLSNQVENADGSKTNCLPFKADDNTPLEDNPIIRYLAILIRFVMVGVGVIITAVIIIAGIRYTAAKGNPQETAAAKDMIQRAIISIVMYAFSGAIINFLIPGGLL